MKRNRAEDQKRDDRDKVNRDVKIKFTCEDLCELVRDNQERRRRRRERRPEGKKHGPLSRVHPHLTIRTVADAWGDRVPGDPLSLASDLIIEGDGHPSVRVFNFGHMPSFGTIVEFFWLSRDAARLTSNTHLLDALLIPSIPPRHDARARCPKPLPNNARDEIVLVRTWSVSDPWLTPLDAGDRHIGQNRVGWGKAYAGKVTRTSTNPEWTGQLFQVRVEIDESSASTGASARVRIYEQVSGGLPAMPQVDELLPSTTGSLTIAQTLPFADSVTELSFVDHQTIWYLEKEHFTDASGRPDILLKGTLIAV